MTTKRKLTRDDASYLTKLAEEVAHTSGDSMLLDTVYDLIAQASILPEGSRDKNYVELNDLVTYELKESGARQIVTLVEPKEADPRASRVSLLTPVGLALIGTKIGATAEVALPSGKTQVIKILAAEPQWLPAA